MVVRWHQNITSPPATNHNNIIAAHLIIDRRKMRSRLLNQIPKAIRSSGGSSTKQCGRSTPLTSPSSASTATQSQIHHQRQSQSSAMMQQRLFGTNNINMARTALGVEGCSIALSLVLEGVVVEPNLPRGWDAGVEDDDGG